MNHISDKGYVLKMCKAQHKKQITRFLKGQNNRRPTSAKKYIDEK